MPTNKQKGSQRRERAPARQARRKVHPTRDLQLANIAGLPGESLIRMPVFATMCSLSLAKMYELAAAGKLPKPAIREARMTVWRLADVRDWLTERAAAGTIAGSP